MESLQLTTTPSVQTAMLIRRPVADVFEAFVDPAVTTMFWFTKGSGRLETGKAVHWNWEMYGISIPVTAKLVKPYERIVIEWPGYGTPTTVEWTFTPYEGNTTFVRVSETGFTGDADTLVKHVAASTQGFTLVLAGAKAFLEHGIRLNLVADRYPKGLESH